MLWHVYVINTNLCFLQDRWKLSDKQLRVVCTQITKVSISTVINIIIVRREHVTQMIAVWIPATTSLIPTTSVTEHTLGSLGKPSTIHTSVGSHMHVTIPAQRRLCTRHATSSFRYLKLHSIATLSTVCTNNLSTMSCSKLGNQLKSVAIAMVKRHPC